ncbi:receptor-type tyrosine-protein phosphatase T-like isoform X2 [Biomphalaria pfeifferi]|uniref:Receptor-type tyrosine-protein phosphatase T-like isoform X2 n=1 Tax=Biomphalaria pfeifferi TaxID=112525 RepID=A0AAD8BGM4_BIOPF|nr:receptor-type tyrosine-protein phosphatase T-like isoform X2 [Biomphalaria pfeifferi]
MTCCGFETWAEVNLGLILTIVLKAQLATAVDEFNPTVSTNCPEGWTGPKCDYKCFCSMEKCNEYSECQDSVSCLENYFGPACQYVNIVPNSIEHTGPILDQLESTCTSMSNGSSQKVQFERPQAFTFLRLFLEDLSKMTSVDVQFSGGDFKTKRSCETFSYMYISSTTMDVHCYTSELYTEVEVIWYGDVDVCGIYISGGRNLVARSSANSSSSEADETADKAVDSHTPSNTICFHSSANDTDPRFSVSLTGMVRIHKVILYGCDDCEMNVSSGPNHLSMKENSTSLQAHQQEWNLLLHLVSPTISIKSKSVDLTLCEIVVLGDCQKGHHGLDCLWQCKDYCPQRRCDLLHDTCASCGPYHYGTDCKKACPDCGGLGLCENLKGACLEGCKPNQSTKCISYESVVDNGTADDGSTMTSKGEERIQVWMVYLVVAGAALTTITLCFLFVSLTKRDSIMNLKVVGESIPPARRLSRIRSESVA